MFCSALHSPRHIIPHHTGTGRLINPSLHKAIAIRRAAQVRRGLRRQGLSSTPDRLTVQSARSASSWTAVNRSARKTHTSALLSTLPSPVLRGFLPPSAAVGTSSSLMGDHADPPLWPAARRPPVSDRRRPPPSPGRVHRPQRPRLKHMPRLPPHRREGAAT